MHDAFFGFGACTLLGLGEIGRRRDEDLAPAGIAGLFPGLVIGPDLLGEAPPSGVAHRSEDRCAASADRRKGVGGAGGNANRRGRLLVRLWHYRDFLEAVVPALIREARL